MPIYFRHKTTSEPPVKPGECPGKPGIGHRRGPGQLCAEEGPLLGSGHRAGCQHLGLTQGPEQDTRTQRASVP